MCNAMLAFAFAGSVAIATACGDSTATSSSGTKCPSPETASQTVTFRFQPGTKTKYVAVAGTYCSAFLLTQGTTSFLTTRPFQCGCECAGPRAYVERLAPAGGTFAWPAATLATCTEPQNCGLGPDLATAYVSQRVAPGAYRMTFVTFDALPNGCNELGGEVSCGGGVTSSPLAPQACTGDGTAAVDFVVPATGDVTVDVPLP
jgi:hypothetical protein